MKARLLLASAAFSLSTMTALAIPAKPVKKTIAKTDGSTIELTLRGDEHYSFYTDEEGTPYRLGADGQLKKLTREIVAETWTKHKADRLSRMPQRASARTRAPWQAGTPGAITGQHRGLVILIEYQDQKFATEDTQKTFERFFNEEGFNRDGMSGSVRDYFLKQSYGQLDITFDVVGPYLANGSMAHYGAHNGDEVDVRPTELIMEAIDNAAKDVDFTPYDWDNDGEVDQVFIIYAGYGEAQGADENTIWPHEWALSAQGIRRTYNNKVINTYACAAELMGSGRNGETTMDGIGTACHEFSHCLGLPDMYDTGSQENFGTGYWDVMCAGSYNGNSRTPAGYTSYERMFAGWLTPTELKDMTRITDMKPLATNAEAYILYNEANRNEYYLLENRQLIDFDAALYGHGLLVLHVDYSEGAWTNNTVNNSAERQRMTIIPADGQLYASRSSLAGDPFPGTTGNSSLTNYSSPAATLYNENADGQKLMSKPVDNIKESEDGLISFVACRPELSIPEPDGGVEASGGTFTITWPAVTGATSYEVEVTEIGTASTDPKEALEREFNFDEFVSKTAGFSDVSSKMADYGLKNWSGSKIFTTPNKMRLGTSTSTGYVRTATWSVPQSTEITIVMGADVVKAGDIVKGQVRVAYGNSGESASYENLDFEVKGNDRQVFHFTVYKDLFWIEIRPEKQMYLNYLAVYDGTWSTWQLGIDHARRYAPRKAAKTTVYPTDTNSLQLTDQNTSSRFVYRVRALGEEDTYSQWSEEKTFKFTASGISDAIQTPSQSNTVYDLQGRKVSTSGAGLRKGIYIIGGKKVVK